MLFSHQIKEEHRWNVESSLFCFDFALKPLSWTKPFLFKVLSLLLSHYCVQIPWESNLRKKGFIWGYCSWGYSSPWRWRKHGDQKGRRDVRSREAGHIAVTLRKQRVNRMSSRAISLKWFMSSSGLLPLKGLQPSQTATPAGYQVFRHDGLQGNISRLW